MSQRTKGLTEAEIQALIADSTDWPNGDPSRRLWRRFLRRLAHALELMLDAD